MKGLILCGGTGSRLRPLTFSTPKQLLPVANKPVLFYLIEKIRDAGIKEIGIITGDTHNDICRAAGNREQWQVDITFINQARPLGIAHAVKTAEEFISGDDFIMLLGDNLFNTGLDKLIKSFYREQADAAILLHQSENTSSCGVAVVKDKRVIRVVEKPSEFISDLIITGVYVFNKNIFGAIEKIRPSLRGELEITDALQSLLDMNRKITFNINNTWWKDTGKPQDLLEANRLILDGICAKNISCLDSSLVIGEVILGKNTKLKNCIIKGPAIIGNDTVISDSCIGSHTSIADDVKIDRCNIEDSIILSGASLSNLKTRLRNSIIGKNSSIKASMADMSYSSLVVGDFSEIILRKEYFK